MSGGQFTFDLTKPTDNSQESVFPALDRADKTTLVSVLGTLLPSSTASTSKRQTQIADVYVEAFNAVYASASGNWGSENTAIDSYGLRFNNAVDLIEVVYHPSTTTSWSSAQWQTLVTINPSTGVLALGTTPAASGTLRLPNLVGGALMFRNGANSADLNGLYYDSSNNMFIGDTSAAIYIFGGSANIRFGGVIQNPNGTTTMGLAQKKGSGAGDYSNTNTTYADLDGTNLAYTVTIPTGWKMLINCALAGNSTGNNGNVALTDGTTLLAEAVSGLGNTNNGVALTYEFTGDGASHTFKLRVLTVSGTWTIRNGSATNTPMMTFLLIPSN